MTLRPKPITLTVNGQERTLSPAKKRPPLWIVILSAVLRIVKRILT